MSPSLSHAVIDNKASKLVSLEEKYANPPGSQTNETSAPGGFLQMWKNITEDINQKRLSVLPSHSERCIIIEVGKELLTELDEFSAIQKGHHVAIDFQEILPQEGTSQTWMHGEVIPVKLVKCLEGHEGPVLSVLAHGIRIFSGGLDQRIKLWDSAGQCYGRMDHHLKGGVLDMAIGADEKCRTLYSGSWDLNVTAWDSITFRRIDVLVGHTDTVSAVEVDSRFVVSASHDGTIRVWSVRTHKCERVIKHHTGAVLCLTFNHRRIISGGADKLVLLIDPETGKLLKKFEGHKTAVTAVQNRQDLIISGDRDGNVFFWSLCGDGKPEDSMKAHNGQINGIAFYQTRFFTVSNDKLVKEWDLLTLRCVRILQGHTDAVTDIKWNSHYLVTCSRDGSVRLWMWDFIEDN